MAQVLLKKLPSVTVVGVAVNRLAFVFGSASSFSSLTPDFKYGAVSDLLDLDLRAMVNVTTTI